MLTPGQSVERYTVESVIGQGGMAVVYRVRHNQLGSFHALKILTVPKPNIRERLLQEGRAQAVIRHPNVVSVTDVLEIAGAPALLMEYVEGPTLEAWLETESPTLDLAEELFRGICAGVGEAHVHGLVHRDLKPSNVLLATRGSGDPGTGFLPKVTDFGIAKVVAGDEPGGSTRTNVAMGTPHYMAPEQIRDAKGVDPRADVFSLGCILYELVCGVRAFDGGDVLTVLNSVASGRYAHPRTHVPDLPDRFVRAIEGALTVDRNSRIQSCAALTAILAGAEPVEHRPTWNPPPTSTDVNHNVPPKAPVTGDNVPFAGEATVPVDIALSNETPSMMIDPNAMTVPRPQRVETPAGPVTGDGSTAAKGIGVAVMVLAILAGVGGVALFPYLQERASADSRPLRDDGAVLGITQHPETVLSIHPPPADPVPAVDPARPEVPSVRVDPRRPPPDTAIHATSPPTEATKPTGPGLGLFGAKEAPPAPGKGRVVFIGDVKSTLYVHGLHSSPVTQRDLPPGKYDVEAMFPGEAPRIALEGLDVHADEVVFVNCGLAWKTCERKP